MAFCAGCIPYVGPTTADLDDDENMDYKKVPDARSAVKGTTEDGSVDWRGRPADKATTGGWKTAPFIYGAAMFETIVSLGIAFNLMTYLTGPMHLPTVTAATDVTNYWGTSFITSLIGGYVADAYLGRYWTTIIAALIELLGIILLVITAAVPGLKPNCPANDKTCPPFTGTTGYALFFFALYMIALGTGCVRPNLSTLGADQFDQEDPEEKRSIRKYFNWLFFFMSIGAIVSITGVIYLAENVSWVWGFATIGFAMVLSTISFLAGTPLYRHQRPHGSPLTRAAQVLVAAGRKWRAKQPADSTMLFEVRDEESAPPTLKRYHSLPHSKGMTLLDKAAVVQETETGSGAATAVDPWRLCTVTQVEELKKLLRCLPVTFGVLFLYMVVGQMQTWGVEQGYTMERRIGKHFQYPPPSLSAIAAAFVLVEIAIYDRWFVPFVRRYTGHSHGITHLQRIGLGLVLSIFAMAYASVVETIRLRVARSHNLVENPMATVPMSIFWLLPQWILLFSADLFTYVGLLEFFWSESPVEMRGLSAGLSLLAISLGFFQSGVLVPSINGITKKSNHGWVHDSNLNKNHLNYYYAFLAVCSFLNFVVFVVATRWYEYKTAINTRPYGVDDSAAPGGESAAAEMKASPMMSPLRSPKVLPRSESRTPLRVETSMSSAPSRDTKVSPHQSPLREPLRSPRYIFSPLFSPNVTSPRAASSGIELAPPGYMSPDYSKLKPQGA